MNDRFSVIGAGNLGATLARSLTTAGFPLKFIYRKTKDPSLIAFITDNLQVLLAASDIVFISVQESRIAELANEIAASGNVQNKIFFHSANSGTSDLLEPIRRRGGWTASFSPLQTFPDPSGPPNLFHGVYFLLEGDPMAKHTATTITKRLGAHCIVVEKHQKPLIHIAAIAVSNFFVALTQFAEIQLRRSRGKVDLSMLMPLIRQTLANIERAGPSESLSGPVQRREGVLIKRHSQLLPEVDRVLYQVMSNYLLHLKENCIDQKNHV